MLYNVVFIFAVLFILVFGSSSLTRDQLMPLAPGAQSLKRWPAREVPSDVLFIFYFFIYLFCCAF